MSAEGFHMYRARITFPLRRTARTVYVRGTTLEEAEQVARAVAEILNDRVSRGISDRQGRPLIPRPRPGERASLDAIEATDRWTPLGGAVDPFVREVTLEEAILWALQGGFP